ncbi:MAG: hypothetical protein ACR2L6_11880 [Gemmatimonadaceae bacterium]
MTLHVTARAATTLLLLVFVACGDATAPDEIPPTQTTFNARVVSPHQDDGAVFVELAGEIRSVTAASGTTLYAERSGSVTRVLALRDAAGAAEWFTMVVAPGAAKPAAKVLAAANLQDLPREDVSAYRVEY